MATSAIKITPISLGDTNIKAGEPVRVGIANCKAMDTLAFRLDNVPTSRASIDVYKGNECTSTDRDNTTTTSSCTFIGNFEIGTQYQNLRIDIPADALADDCDGGGNENSKLWFLAVNQSVSNENVGSSYAAYQLQVDLNAPTAPSSVDAGTGENEIPVSWSLGDTSDTIERFLVLIDSGSGGTIIEDDAGAGAGDGGVTECGTGALVEGRSAEDLPDSVRQQRVDNAAASSTNISADSVAGGVAAIAVVTVDRAGNRSEISNVTCLRVVPTESYRDAYENANGSLETGCPCSAPGPAQAESALPIVLALGLLVARARRSRS